MGMMKMMVMLSDGVSWIILYVWTIILYLTIQSRRSVMRDEKTKKFDIWTEQIGDKVLYKLFQI